MWELNYDDLPSLYGFSSTYSIYDAGIPFWVQRSLIDMLNDNTGVPIINRAKSRKHIREIHRRNVIRNRIISLLGGVPMDKRHSFTKKELIELYRIKHNEASYDYWPISKSVTRRLRGLVKKQKGRRVIMSLGDFLAYMPLNLDEIEV